MQNTTDFIREHLNDNVRTLALKAAGRKDIDLAFALNQIAGWQTARRKLPSWAATEGIVYPPHISMEQCSSEPAALYKTAVAARLINEGIRTGEDNEQAGEDGELTGEDNEQAREDGERTRANNEQTKDSGSMLIDITGGFGVDFSFMARVFDEAVYVEQQEHLCSIAEHNLRLLGLRHVTVVNGDGISRLRSPERRATMIFADPARRDNAGGRTFAISDCTPDVLDIMDVLLSKANYVMLKLSPMLDWRKAVNDLNTAACHTTVSAVREVHIVSVGNECKELLIVLASHKDERAEEEKGENKKEKERTATTEGNDTIEGITVCCVNIPSVTRVPSATGATSSTESSSVTRASSIPLPHQLSQNGGRNICADILIFKESASQPILPQKEDINIKAFLSDSFGRTDGEHPTLYEPNASIMKAGCFSIVEQRYGVRQIGPNSHLFVSNSHISGFPGRRFIVEAVTSMNKRELRTALAGISKANITVRNFPMTVAELYRRLKIGEGGSKYIFATTLADGAHVLIVCTKPYI